MRKVERVNVVVKELIVIVNIRCAEVKRERGGVVVLADTVLNVIVGEVLQGWVNQEKVFRYQGNLRRRMKE